MDEIHTPDSSRYWIKGTYKEKFENDQEPESIDKEFLRLWFKENSDPYRDENLPPAPRELITELAKRYILLCEKITGNPFEANVGNIEERIVSNLKSKNHL